jgi:hypothetical protein
MATAAANDYGKGEEYAPKITDWKKEPRLFDLKSDLEAAKQVQGSQIAKINRWNDLRDVKGSARPKAIKGRSRVQPKMIRRQNEWRYSALTEPFLSRPDIFECQPATFEDGESAKQNQLVLNHQVRTKFNWVKFIDDYVRSTVDEGTSIIQTGWKRHTVKIKTEVPVYNFFEIQDEEKLTALQEALGLKQANPRGYDEQVDPLMKAAVDHYNETGQATYAEDTGTTTTVETDKILENRPTAIIRNPANVFIDATCEGDLDKALFVVVSFETNKAELLKEGDRYKNLDTVDWEGSSPLSQPDHVTQTPDPVNLHDALRKKVVAYEYWGFYDVNDDGTLVPFVCTWIGSTIIRLELSPFPDEALPFVLVPYLPVKRELYGETDAELLEDNQAVQGAVMRGLIDLLGRSANAQQGMAKGMLDPLNRRKFEQGLDYEFNPNISPQQGLIEHKYPEIPQSAIVMLNLQNQDAEALTGVKSFAGGMSGDAFGDVAAGIRGVLDAASKREMGILRRLAKGLVQVATKIAAMNAVFLSETETVRITNTQFVTVKREDLAGNFDIKIDISSAEVDAKRIQDLAFMLQTLGNTVDIGITLLILSEIARLMKMPELAEKISKFQPQPDPLVVKEQELKIKKLEAEIAEIMARTGLHEAKAEETVAKTDAVELGTAEQADGTAHARDMEKQRGQAEGNQDLEVTKALLKTKKPDEKDGDVEAAIGFRELSSKDRNNHVPPTASLALPEPAPAAPDIGGAGLPIDPAMADQPLGPTLE